MHEHPQFVGLVIHDDDELGALLGGTVIARTLVHEWPLTRTEDIRLADGRRYAYKAQLPPTVEPQFYGAASSTLLSAFRDLGRSGNTSFLATDWIDAPTLHDSAASAHDFVDHARAVVRAIGEIAGNLPVFLDISTPDAFGRVAAATADRLASLIGRGRYANLPPDTADRIRSWASSAAVISEAASNTQVTQGDLSPEEVFLVGDGYRVIDWQRPVRGPADLDLVSLLRYRRIDPLLHVSPETVQLSWFILLHWSALAQTELLPDLPPDIPEGWALAALPHILAPQPP